MGRRPEPVNREIEELAALAAALRAVRHAAGNPPLRTMAMRARYSASTLSEAASGRRLPTLPVVLAYVAACGADSAGWEDRWRQAGAAVHAHNEPTAPNRDTSTGDCTGATRDPALPEGSGSSGAGLSGLPQAQASADAVPRGAGEDPHPGKDDIGRQPGAGGETVASGFDRATKNRRVRTVYWALCGTVLTLALTGYLTRSQPAASVTAPTTGSGSLSPRVIKDDTDPQDTGCDKGQVDTVATALLYGPDRFFLGYVWLRYAPACRAMWTRFEPAAGLAELGGAKVTIWIVRPADGRTLQYDTPYLGAFVYGNMLQASHGCLQAEATVTAPHPSEGPAASLPTEPIVAHAETQCVLPPASNSTM